MVVFNSSDCTTPNQSELIVGFATIVVTEVSPQYRLVRGRVICNDVVPGLGAADYYGIKGSIPVLVE